MDSQILSAAGNVVLTKYNLTDIFQYPMNWFKFPKYVPKEIGKVNRDFFWDNNTDHNNNDKHKLHNFAWDKIRRPKCESGLGI